MSKSPLNKRALNKDAVKKAELSGAEIDRIIQMAWEDRTTFDAIKVQFGLSPGEVINSIASGASIVATWPVSSFENRSTSLSKRVRISSVVDLR